MGRRTASFDMWGRLNVLNPQEVVDVVLWDFRGVLDELIVLDHVDDRGLDLQVGIPFHLLYPNRRLVLVEGWFFEVGPFFVLFIDAVTSSRWPILSRVVSLCLHAALLCL